METGCKPGTQTCTAETRIRLSGLLTRFLVWLGGRESPSSARERVSLPTQVSLPQRAFTGRRAGDTRQPRPKRQAECVQLIFLFIEISCKICIGTRKSIFRLPFAGRYCAAASRVAFFKGKTLQNRGTRLKKRPPSLGERPLSDHLPVTHTAMALSLMFTRALALPPSSRLTSHAQPSP